MKKIFLENIADLAETQRASFFSFIYKGISAELKLLENPLDGRFLTKKVLKEQKIKLEKNPALYFFTEEVKVKGPYESLQNAQLKHISYCLQIFATTYYYTKKLKTIVEQDLLLAEVPLITDDGTFLITGYERIIVNQIIRSPGVYFRKEYGLSKSSLQFAYTATIISDKGIWTKVILGASNKGPDNVYIKLSDLTGKSDLIKEANTREADEFSLFYFLQYFGIDASEIFDSLEYPKNKKKKYEFAKQIYAWEKKANDETLEILEETFYDAKVGCFSIGEIGRFKINKRLSLNLPKDAAYITSQDILIIISKLFELKYGNTFTDDIDHIKNKQIRSVGDFLKNQFRIGLCGAYQSDDLYYSEDPDFAPVKYDTESISEEDIKRFVKKGSFCDPYPISSAFKEFFKTSQLSQFMDQINPLSELAQKRRVSVFGPNGLKRDHISTIIRDIHPSQYARLCPVETPEGQNAGLITSLALYSRIASLGWLEAPYYLIQKGNLNVTQQVIYLNPEQESQTKVAFCDVSLSKGGKINTEYLSAKDDVSFITKKKTDLEFLSLSPLQLLSVATALIPFMEHDDANRALMGSNMQRQAVPLLYPQKAIVGTGLESTSIIDSGMVIKTYSEGYVQEANSSAIKIRDKYGQAIKYYLQKYFRSNQETCINQKANVWQGEKVFSGQIIADGISSLDAELALGRNLTVAYMPWEGYNYEDAIILSEKLVLENSLTSIHIEEYEVLVPEFYEYDKERKLNLKALPLRARQNLDENGIIKIGSYVREHDILFGKVVRAEGELTGEQRLMLAINKNEYIVKDASFKLPSGSEGRIIEIRVFPSPLIQKEFFADEEKNEAKQTVEFKLEINKLLPSSKKIKFFVAQARKIEVGDKLAGRHGNKGIISRILSKQDMPHLPNGEPIDIIFNPLGVPSRMNVGQIFECLLGFAGENLGKRFKVKSFDEIYGQEASRILITQKLKQASIKKDLSWLFSISWPGKIFLRDGRTGEFFDNPITVGKSYILKLIHLVKDKIHARDTGPYSMITEQPLSGKSQQGGQRLGEMEVWALEAYGASYTLQELLTVKSDDIDARMDIYESILTHNFKEKPSVSMPEGFLLLIRELNALGLEFELKKAISSQDYNNISGHSRDNEEFVDIFKEVEERLKLRAIYQRKKFDVLPLKKPFQNENQGQGYTQDLRVERKLNVLKALKNLDFSKLVHNIK